MIDFITRTAAADSIELFAREGRLVQNSWHTVDDKGRRLACLLGAIDPEIYSATSCPTSVMPDWMAELLITLFDGVRHETCIGYGLRFAEALRRGNTDESVLRRFLAFAVEDAVKSAKPLGDAPAYWPAVETACSDVCVLLGRDAPKDELMAAWAARAAGAAGAAYERMFDCLITEMTRGVP